MIPAGVSSAPGAVGKPRASGDDPLRKASDGSVGLVNPARAGMILTRPEARLVAPRKPRASGDDPVLRAWLEGETA